MHKLLLILFPLIMNFSDREGKETHRFIGENYDVTYETYKGLMNGEYICHYKNGQKRSRGNFRNNYRIGEWAVWDSSGNVVVKRVFSKPFEFKQTMPALPEEPLVQSPNYDVWGHNVLWSKNYWRILKPENNPAIFENDALIDLLNDKINQGELQRYTCSDNGKINGEMTEPLNVENYEIVALRLLDYAYFDIKNALMEFRVQGIGPVGVHNNAGDTATLFFVYFDLDLRETEINPKQVATNIKNFDDLFFYRAFSSQILKHGEMYPRPISDSAKSKQRVKHEAERMEIEMIETEHDLWMWVSGIKKGHRFGQPSEKER